jgi:outer membrane receptor protein involved in Fe transport
LLLSAALIECHATGALAQTANAPDQAATKPAAGDGAVPLEDIIVTAQRRDQSLLQVPIAMSAIGGEALTRMGVLDTSQLAATVPNLQVNSAYGKTQPNFSMRGIGVGNEYNANQASPIGVYIDDAYIASRASHGAQLFDLERIEVLRGPQGTLFGRNTTGGAINIITRVPTLDTNGGYAEAGYGNFNAVHLQGAVEGAVVPDVLGVRLSFNFDRNDPKFDNLIAGQPDPDGGKSVAARLAVRFKPTDRLDINLKVYGSEDRLSQAALHAIGSGPGGVNPLTGYSRSGLDFYDVESGKLGFRETNSWGFLGRIAYEVSDALTLSSLTSRDGGYFAVRNDSGASPFQLLDFYQQSRSNQFNQELKAAYSKGGLDVIAGGYYGRDTSTADNRFEFYFFRRVPGQPADPTGANGGFTIFHHYKQVRVSKAVFTQIDYKLNDHWAVTAGGRYTWDKARYEQGLAYIGDYSFNPIFYTVAASQNGTPIPTRKGSDGAATYRAALTYTFDGGGIVYGSFNHGYRAGTFNGAAYLDASQIYYTRPETVNAYEIGTKGRLFDGAMTYSASVFLNKYKNQQTVELAGIVSFLRNAGESTIYGGELELNGRITSDLRLHGSLGLLHSKYDSLTLSGVNLKGNELPFAPKVTGSVGLDWTIGEVGGGDVAFMPNVSYVSRQYFSPFNDQPSFVGDPVGNSRLKQNGYAKVDASLSWTRDRFSVRVAADNLLQRKYYLYGIDLRSALGFDLLTPSGPRTFTVTLRRNF